MGVDVMIRTRLFGRVLTLALVDLLRSKGRMLMNVIGPPFDVLEVSAARVQWKRHKKECPDIQP
jgi:hypothetical protein